MDDTHPGSPLLLGAYLLEDGAQFALFSRRATRVQILFFNHPEDEVPSRTIELDPEENRTGDIWHVWVKGVQPGQLYGYRIDGPYRPEEGHRFNKYKLLLDPYARAISEKPFWDFSKATGYDAESPMRDLSFSTENPRGFYSL